MLVVLIVHVPPAELARLAGCPKRSVPDSNCGSIYHHLAEIHTLQVKLNSRSTDAESKWCIRLAGHGFLSVPHSNYRSIYHRLADIRTLHPSIPPASQARLAACPKSACRQPRFVSPAPQEARLRLAQTRVSPIANMGVSITIWSISALCRSRSIQGQRMRKVNGAFDSQGMGSYVSPIATMGKWVYLSPFCRYSHSASKYTASLTSSAGGLP